MSPAYREETGPGWEVRLGRWQDVLADVGEVDAVICDPPYSARTISGQRSGTLDRDAEGKVIGKGTLKKAIRYEPITEDDARGLIRHWSSRTRRWIVVFGDHLLWQWCEDEAKAVGWMTFQPIPWLKSDGGTPRFTADGPAAASEWVMIARPRKQCVTRFRPGYYLTPPNYERHDVVGAKPSDLMRAVIRDYSEPGDLVVDPFCGSGTTALAAVMEGRRAITAEVDPNTYDLAVRRLRRGHTPDMFTAAAQGEP